MTVVVAVAFVGVAVTATLVRVVVGGAANRPDGLAWGTLAVNVVGSLVLGLVAGASTPVLTVVGTGAMGALTTFSGFARDTVVTARRAPLLAVVYVGLMLVAGLAGAWLGLELAPGT